MELTEILRKYIELAEKSNNVAIDSTASDQMDKIIDYRHGGTCL